MSEVGRLNKTHHRQCCKPAIQVGWCRRRGVSCSQLHASVGACKWSSIGLVTF